LFDGSSTVKCIWVFFVGNIWVFPKIFSVNTVQKVFRVYKTIALLACS